MAKFIAQFQGSKEFGWAVFKFTSDGIMIIGPVGICISTCTKQQAEELIKDNA